MYNDIKEFCEDLKNELTEMIMSEVIASIEYCLQTHNIKPIIEIRKILKSANFKE